MSIYCHMLDVSSDLCTRVKSESVCVVLSGVCVGGWVCVGMPALSAICCAKGLGLI